jgi:protease-4
MKPKSFVFLWALVTVACMTMGCQQPALLIQPVSANKALKERVIQKDKGLFVRDKIAVIDVDGELSHHASSGLFGSRDNPVSLFIEKLNMARHDRAVKAVVLRINSPGGGVGATDVMYHSLKEFKQQTGKPVIACMLDVGASGGYYLACGADGIIAQPSCITGSIGVIMQAVSVAGTMEKIGVTAVAIKSGELKDMASPLKPLQEKERAVLQEIVLHLYDQFLSVVHEARPAINEDRLKSLADGRVYTAGQAEEAGLIDRIGYLNDAVAWAKHIANLEKTQVVIYHRPIDYKPNLYSSAVSPIEPGALVNIAMPRWLQSEGPQFLYLWQPEIE